MINLPLWCQLARVVWEKEAIKWVLLALAYFYMFIVLAGPQVAFGTNCCVRYILELLLPVAKCQVNLHYTLLCVVTSLCCRHVNKLATVLSLLLDYEHATGYQQG